MPSVPGRPSGRSFTLCDVRRHTTEDDCWLVAHGLVYDATAMITSHPGGRSSILRHAGCECSEDFDFHSRQAQRLWRDLCIGRLRKCGATPARRSRLAWPCHLQ
jgi:cytochrome b involved in lipid metabolism